MVIQLVAIAILFIGSASIQDPDDFDANSGILLAVRPPMKVGTSDRNDPNDRKFQSRKEVINYGCRASYNLAKNCIQRVDGSFYVDGASLIDEEQITIKSGEVISTKNQSNTRLRLFYDKFYVDLNVISMKETDYHSFLTQITDL